MKKIYLNTFLLFIFSLSLQANVIYQDYGDGLVFPINEASELDITGDGILDFSINLYPGEISLYPASACFSSTNMPSEIGNGSGLLVVEEGATIGAGMFFEDFDDLPLYVEDGNTTLSVLADGEFHYVGTMFWTENKYGWIKIKIDAVNQTLIVKSTAYESASNVAIFAGAGEPIVEEPDPIDVDGEDGLGATPVGVEDVFLSAINAFPNPVSDLLHIEFELAKAARVEFVCYNTTGQKVFVSSRDLNAGLQQEGLDFANLDAGFYHLVIQSGDAMLSRKINVK